MCTIDCSSRRTYLVFETPLPFKTLPNVKITERGRDGGKKNRDATIAVFLLCTFVYGGHGATPAVRLARHVNRLAHVENNHVGKLLLDRWLCVLETRRQNRRNTRVTSGEFAELSVGRRDV